jgi:hypothetical protein
VAPLAGRLDELVPLAELIELAVVHGFMPVAVHEASIDEWDEFESGFSACYARWLVEHGPDHPAAVEVRTRAARQRAGYFSGYRGVMGIAYLALLAVVRWCETRRPGPRRRVMSVFEREESPSEKGLCCGPGVGDR